MIRQIIDWLILGQMLGGVLFVLYLIITGVLSAYKSLFEDIHRTKTISQDVLLFRRNKKEFMDWKKERDKHE